MNKVKLFIMSGTAGLFLYSILVCIVTQLGVPFDITWYYVLASIVFVGTGFLANMTEGG